MSWQASLCLACLGAVEALDSGARLSQLPAHTNNSPDVEYCGYSAPHPSEPKIHLRVQMYDGLSAVDALRRALANLRSLFTTVQTEFASSLKWVVPGSSANPRNDDYVKEDDVDVHAVVAETLRQRGFAVEGDEMEED